jgi:hypothetical protein
VSRGRKSTRIIPSVWGAGFPRFAVDTIVVPPARNTFIE